MTIETVLMVLMGSCVGGFVAGVSGFAFGLVSLAFWIWVLDPPILAPLVVLGSIAIQATSLGTLYRRLEWSRLIPFLVGGAAGVPIGIMLLNHIEIAIFKIAVGIVLLSYSSYLLIATPCFSISFGGKVADTFIGLLGGIMGGLAGLSGPPPVLWCMMRGWDKDVQRSVTQSSILFVQVITVAGYAQDGKLTLPVWELFGLMLPALLVSGWAGARICVKINEHKFRRVILLLLFVSGAMLLVSTYFGPSGHHGIPVALRSGECQDCQVKTLISSRWLT